MTGNRRVVLEERPAGKARASDFGIEDGPVPTPVEGQVLVEYLYLSVDPGLRNLLGAETEYR